MQALAETTYPTDVVAEADMVMKGGITSGVVYPLAVCRLAPSYRFRNLGGSSAGGIAAAVAAAAECNRGGGGFPEAADAPVPSRHEPREAVPAQPIDAAAVPHPACRDRPQAQGRRQEAALGPRC